MPHDYGPTVAHLLATHRSRTATTQVQAAKEIGVSTMTYNRWETRSPRSEHPLPLARSRSWLGCTLSELGDACIAGLESRRTVGDYLGGAS